jgi:hypothetical protein
MTAIDYTNAIVSFACECTHNRSQHRMEWDGFRGGWNTRCRHAKPGKEPCRCPEFRPVNA